MCLCIDLLVSLTFELFLANSISSLSGFAWDGLLKAREVEEHSNELLNEIYLQEENNMRMKSFPSLEEVEQIIGYNFNDRDLLEEAFTHPTYKGSCFSYRRLEYVGDSVLNLLITKEQFFLYPDFSPGLLSPLRAANVDTEKLARVAVQHKLHRYLRHRHPVLINQIQEFIAVLPRHPLHSNGLINAPKFLADIVESTIGATFVDSNSSIDTTWKVAKGLLQPLITPELLGAHPVKKLYETCQKNGLKVRVVDRWLKEGAYEIIVGNRLKGRGSCRSKKEIALNRAANNAYEELVRELGLKDSVGGYG
ncbi:ribonuclease 3-like protein 3 isoform X2 [Diospyros lotus]|uniref:ribonuclease 3-like protein 3 isoform X2 n=1 Tax=Diospyros lotus TaxID=55363 RepID=UPI00225A2D8C|nr:ribonuclease 3-like protein 3 isoform X2 [Diospyros lotus]